MGSSTSSTPFTTRHLFHTHLLIRTKWQPAHPLLHPQYILTHQDMPKIGYNDMTQIVRHIEDNEKTINKEAILKIRLCNFQFRLVNRKMEGKSWVAFSKIKDNHGLWLTLCGTVITQRGTKWGISGANIYPPATGLISNNCTSVSVNKSRW